MILLNPSRTLAYIPIAKNASKIYSESFLSAGWSEHSIAIIKELEHTNIKPFAHIQDPFIRHTKGIVEWITRTKNRWMLDDERCYPMLATGILDLHTSPISFTFPSWLLKTTHWIPISDKLVNINSEQRKGQLVSADELTLDFLKQHNELNVIILEESQTSIRFVPDADDRFELRKKLNKIKEKHETHSLQYMYDVDLKIWNDCLPYHDSVGNAYHFKELLNNG